MILVLLLPLFIESVSIEIVKSFVSCLWVTIGLIFIIENKTSDEPWNCMPHWRRLFSGLYLYTETPYFILKGLGFELELWIRIVLLIAGDVLIRFPEYSNLCENIADHFDRRKLDEKMRDKMMHLQALSQKSRTNDEKMSEVKKAVENALKEQGL